MLQYIINLVMFLPLVLVLIVLSMKLSKFNLEGLGTGRYTKIIERTSLKKDTDLFVLKIGDEGCVILSSPHKIENLKNLTKEEIDQIDKKRKESKVAIKTFIKKGKKDGDSKKYNF